MEEKMRLLILLTCLLVATPAFAQGWPDLLGTWKGTSRTVVAGDGGHFSGTNANKPEFRETELTIEWTDQDDGRYFGTITSASHTEPKLGIASSDGSSFYTVDLDGHSSGRLIDANHFELCYLQSSYGDRQMVASCVIFERQR